MTGWTAPCDTAVTHALLLREYRSARREAGEAK